MTGQDRLAVVTASASGIGLVTAKTLARDGWRLVLSDADEDKGRHAAREVVVQAVAAPAVIHRDDQAHIGEGGLPVAVDIQQHRIDRGVQDDVSLVEVDLVGRHPLVPKFQVEGDAQLLSHVKCRGDQRDTAARLGQVFRQAGGLVTADVVHDQHVAGAGPRSG